MLRPSNTNSDWSVTWPVCPATSFLKGMTSLEPIVVAWRLYHDSRRRPVPKAAAETIEVAGITLTHPDRVLWPKQGLTKRDLAEFYAGIADRILPHVVNRPLTLVRCPSGSDGGSVRFRASLPSGGGLG